MYRFKKIDNHGQTTYIVIIDKKTEVTVSQQVYEYMIREKEKRRHRARINGQCGTSSFWKCDGECETCKYVQMGFNMIPLDVAFKPTTDPSSGEKLDSLNNIPDAATSLPDAIVADRDLLARLRTRLDELVPNGGRIHQMLSEEYTDREMTKALNLKQQSTLNYRKRKVIEFIRKHRDEYFD